MELPRHSEPLEPEVVAAAPGPEETLEPEAAALGPPEPEVEAEPPGAPGLKEPEVATAPPEPSEREAAAGSPGPAEPPGPSELKNPEVAAAPPGSSEPEVATEPPGPPEPSEPEVAAAPPGPKEPSEPLVATEPPGSSEPEVAAEPPESPKAAAAAACGAGAAEEAGGGAGAAAEAPPAALAERTAAAPEDAERRDATEKGEEERRERADLLEQHRGLASAQERLRRASARLQHRQGERPGRGERPRRAERSPAGLEPFARRLPRLREQRERLESCRRGGEERRARAEAAWAAFQARKKGMVVASLGRRLGGRAAAELIQAREQDEDQRVQEARVESISLKHEVQNLKTIVKAQGEAVEGQQLVDFEHMKSENQKQSKKIDNLSHEILKLKKKVSNTVHNLTQLMENMQFVEADIEGRKAELGDIEILSQKRDILTKTKQDRDSLQTNNLKLQQKRQLLGNEILLQDFEQVDTVEVLRQRLETLRSHHASLILTCRGI